MGKITTVYYAEIDPSICSTIEASEFYFHYNMMAVDPIFMKDYEGYEVSQMHIRNDIIGKAIACGDIPKHPILNSTIFGVSSVKKKAVILAEY